MQRSAVTNIDKQRTWYVMQNKENNTVQYNTVKVRST